MRENISTLVTLRMYLSLNGTTYCNTRFPLSVTSRLSLSVAVPCHDSDSYCTHCYWNTLNNVWVERDCTCTANQAWGLSGSYWRGKYRQARGKELIGVVKYCTVGSRVICSRHYMIGYLTQWPCCFRRGSAAARLLRLRARIPLGARMSVCLSIVSAVCCHVGLITRREGCYRMWWWSLDNEEALAH
jgi:hypothetical protein